MSDPELSAEDAELVDAFIRSRGVTKLPDGLALGCEFLSGKVDAPAGVVRRNKYLNSPRPRKGRKPSQATVEQREEAQAREDAERAGL